MELQLKQRIIGAVVIFSLLIIFLPMFFESAENKHDNKIVDQLLIPSVSNTTIPNSNDNDIKQKIDLLKKELALRDKTLSKTNSKINNITKPNTKLKTTIKKEPDTKILSSNSSKIKLDITESKDKEIKDKSKTVKNTASKINTNVIKITKDKDFSSLSKTEVYVVRLFNNTSNSYNFVSKKQAEEAKFELLHKGFPVYIKAGNNKKYQVMVGPDLELKYIKELANRVADETQYSAEIIKQDKSSKLS